VRLGRGGLQELKTEQASHYPSQAKRAAKTLLTTEGKAEPRDWFRELHQIAANEVGQRRARRLQRPLKWYVLTPRI
jgi:hypothetical protein